MHRKEELDKAIIKLYNDYKDVIKDYRNGDLKILYDFAKINDEEKKYTKEEVYYIGFNALLLLEQDIKRNNL